MIDSFIIRLLSTAASLPKQSQVGAQMTKVMAAFILPYNDSNEDHRSHGEGNSVAFSHHRVYSTDNCVCVYPPSLLRSKWSTWVDPIMVETQAVPVWLNEYRYVCCRCVHVRACRRNNNLIALHLNILRKMKSEENLNTNADFHTKKTGTVSRLQLKLNASSKMLFAVSKHWPHELGGMNYHYKNH